MYGWKLRDHRSIHRTEIDACASVEERKKKKLLPTTSREKFLAFEPEEFLFFENNLIFSFFTSKRIPWRKNSPETTEENWSRKIFYEKLLPSFQDRIMPIKLLLDNAKKKRKTKKRNLIFNDQICRKMKETHERSHSYLFLKVNDFSTSSSHWIIEKGKSIS